MVKKFTFVFIVFAMFIPVAKVNAATTLPEFVRVGLVSKYSNVSRIPILNDQITVGYESGGIYFETARFAADSGFAVTTTDLYYLRVEQIYTTYGEAKILADTLSSRGHTAIPSNTGINSWMVYVGGYTSEGQANNELNGVSFNSTVVNLNRTGIVLMDGQSYVAIFHNDERYFQVADWNGGVVELSQNSYRGRIEFSRYGDNFLAINVLTMDDYLCGVLPSEMPASWHIEALKAQAVAARSYSVTRSGVHNSSNYDLCDSTHCQMYIGASLEMDSTNRAVFETTGKIAYYDNRIINAVYFSSSGGTTENSENVWLEALPYLKSVNEINETTAKVWTRAFTLAEMTALAASNGLNIGSVIDVRIGRFTAANRVGELIIVGTGGTETLEKERIRTFFSQSQGGSLESLNFNMSNTISEREYTALNVVSATSTGEVELKDLYAASDNFPVMGLASRSQIFALGAAGIVEHELSTTVVTGTVATGVFIFEGRGHGHGVGMSQHGANGMAQIGYTYEQILKHYYTGIEVR